MLQSEEEIVEGDEPLPKYTPNYEATMDELHRGVSITDLFAECKPRSHAYSFVDHRSRSDGSTLVHMISDHTAWRLRRPFGHTR